MSLSEVPAEETERLAKLLAKLLAELPTDTPAAIRTLLQRVLKCHEKNYQLRMELVDLTKDKEFSEAPLPFAQNMKSSSISHSKEDLDIMTSKELKQLMEKNGIEVQTPIDRNVVVDTLLDYYRNQTSKGGKRRSTNRKKTNKRRRSSKRRSSIRNWFSL